MKMTREKKILLSLMLCGAMCSTAYAAVEIPDPIPDGTEWTVGSGDDEVQLHSGTYNIAAGATVTMTEKSDHSDLKGDALYDTEGTELTINGSADSSGKYSTLIINGYSTNREQAVYSSGAGSVINLNNLDLTVHGYQAAISVVSGGSLNITSENMDNVITIYDSITAVNGDGGHTEITVGKFATEDTLNGIRASDSGELYLTANEIDLEGTGTSSGDGVYSTDGGSVTVTGDKITFENFLYGVESGQGGTVIINHTGTGDENTLNFTGDSIGLRVLYGGIARITSEGTINFTGNNNTSSSGGITTTYSNAQMYSEDSPAVLITGNKDTTVINFKENYQGIRDNYYNYAVEIKDVKEINFTNSSSFAIRAFCGYHGIDIDNVGAINVDTAQYGIMSDRSGSWAAKYGVNITNIGDLTVKNCSAYGLYSEDGHGVNITVTDGGSVTVDGNSGGIYTMAVEGITIKGTEDDYFSKFTVTGNGTGIYVDGGGTLDFSARELVATGNGTFAYASGTGTGGTDDDGTTYDSHSSAITLTADKATITGQSENPSNDYTLYAQNGGTISLNVGEITASRDSGYFGYADTNEDSKIEIKADSGTIAGAFWTGATDNTAADSSGIINLDLGTSAEWTVTDDSKVTELTLGDASTLTFSYLGDTDKGSGPFLNLYTSNMASGSGSTINMNINASALNESDHIYINDTHTGTSVINLNANGSDLSDTVLGTILVSVNNESGSFTAGSGTNGTYEGALYNWKYKLALADGSEASRKIEKTGELMDMDGYNYDWYLTDVEIETEEEPEPTPEPGDGGPGPAQPNPGDGGTPTTTTTVEAIKAANAVNYYAFREQDKLLRRMGELRNNGEDEQGVWIRVKGAKTGRHASFENKYIHYEGGYDHLVKNDHREKRYEGFSLSHTEGDVKYKEVTGSGKAHDEEIAFYRVDQYTHGHYLDLVTRIGIYNNRFGVYDTNNNSIHGKNHNYGISTSAEYGRKKDYAHDWYVEPQGQATIGYLSGNEYITSNNVNVSNGSISSAVGRIGVNIGKGFTDKKGRKGKFYGKANWLKEFLGSYGIDMTTENSRRHAHGNYKDTWFEWGFGVTYQYTKNNFFYADVEKSQGSAYYKNWAWNVGLRWTFN